MACKVVWTQSAQSDVKRAVQYIVAELHNPQAASSLLDALDRAISDIATFPEAASIGKKTALSSRGLRKKMVKRYLLLYSYDGDTVVISRKFHSPQDYARILNKG